MTNYTSIENPTSVRFATSTQKYAPPSQQVFSNLHKRQRIVNSSNSPRINGKLKLRENDLRFSSIRNDFELREVTYSYKTTDPNNMGIGKFYIAALAGIPADNAIRPGIPSLSNDDSYYQASKAFYGDLNSLKINLAQVFAERQQTVDLIATNLQRLRDLYLSVRRGRNPFNGKNFNRDRADSVWLESQYGWVPLLSDIHGAIELSKAELPKASHKITRTITRTGRRTLVGTEFISDIQSDITIDASQLLKTTIKALVSVSSPQLAFANSIGLTNPALLAWELLPYSFVVDWALPIGGWLEAQTATLGLSFSNVSVTRTNMCQFNFTKTTKVRASSSSYTRGGAGFQCRGTSVYKDKERVITMPVLLPPRLKSPVSVEHALSALSLLTQAFSRR